MQVPLDVHKSRSGRLSRSAKGKRKASVLSAVTAVHGKLGDKSEGTSPRRDQARLVNRLKEVSTPKPESPVRELGPIWDDELAQLEIKKNGVKIITDKSFIPAVKVYGPPVTFLVRKRDPLFNKRKVRISVLKPVSRHVPTGQDAEISHGPKLDRQGRIIPHSILGGVEDFMKRAGLKIELENFQSEQQEIQVEGTKQMEVSKKFLKRHHLPRTEASVTLNEGHALVTWNKEMKRRRRNQKLLAEYTRRPERELIMTRSSMYNRRQLGREVLGLALDTDNKDTWFWKTGADCGRDLQAIRETMSLRKKGCPPTPVLSGDADSIRIEKGTNCESALPCPWFTSSYVQEKDSECGGVIHVLDPVLFEKLEIVGHSPQSGAAGASKNTEVDKHLADEDRHWRNEKFYQLQNSEAASSKLPKTRFKGPAVCINGKTATWNGQDNHNDVDTETVIKIDCCVKEIVTKQIEIENCGTTFIHYNWKKLPAQTTLYIDHPFSRPFYFRAQEGTVLPGERTQIPVTFHSKYPGCYREMWKIETVPEVAGGKEIKFLFKGLARKSPNVSSTEEVQALLTKRVARSIASDVFNNLLDRVMDILYQRQKCAQQEPRSYSLEEEFELVNPKLHYSSHGYKQLIQLQADVRAALNIADEETAAGVISVDMLYKEILKVEDTAPSTDKNKGSEHGSPSIGKYKSRENGSPSKQRSRSRENGSPSKQKSREDGSPGKQKNNSKTPDSTVSQIEQFMWRFYNIVKQMSFSSYKPVPLPVTDLRYLIARALLEMMCDEFGLESVKLAEQIGIKARTQKNPVQAENKKAAPQVKVKQANGDKSKDKKGKKTALLTDLSGQFSTLKAVGNFFGGGTLMMVSSAVAKFKLMRQIAVIKQKKYDEKFHLQVRIAKYKPLRQTAIIERKKYYEKVHLKVELARFKQMKENALSKTSAQDHNAYSLLQRTLDLMEKLFDHLT